MRPTNHIRPIALAIALIASPTPPALADIQLIATGTIPGDTRDLSGLTSPIGPNQPHDLLGAFGSAIAYSSKDDTYYAATDRGPFDGAAAYRCRIHQFRFTIVPGKDTAPGTVEWKLLKTTILNDGAKEPQPLMGGSGYIDKQDQSKSRRFDPEGIRLARSGQTFFISDEYAPLIREFNLDGTALRTFAFPAVYGVAHPANNAEDELPPHNISGRQTNRGFEGLAISPDGSTLWAMPQSPLIQDGALNAKNDRVGVNIRTLRLNPATGASAEFVYTLDSPKYGTNELLAIDDHRFLTIERDGKPGKDTKAKLIILADFSSASDVSAIKTLPTTGLPEGVTAARKTPFIDLLDPRFTLAGETFPEKIEALTFGPDLPDGRHTLLVASDNDLKPDQPTQLWVFAFSDSDLPGYQPQKFDKEP